MIFVYVWVYLFFLNVVFFCFFFFFFFFFLLALFFLLFLVSNRSGLVSGQLIVSFFAVVNVL